MNVRIAADAEVLQQNPESVTATCAGIGDVLRVSGRDYMFDQDFLSQAESLSFVEQHSSGSTGQVDADQFFMNIRELADAQEPLFVLLSKDLRAEGTNFIFGFGIKEAGICVQSLYRYVREVRQVELPVIVRHIARHEFGHMLGLDGTSIRNQDTRGGLYRGHCANDCTMQQVMTVVEANQRAQRLQTRPNAGFCSGCVEVLQSH
ncbi:hypothetical protein KDA00_01895 [Candidatus Saccharibacteria bacterium]|nr:hypothetical protein [Candidatus Saccharibacteria bacterium]